MGCMIEITDTGVEVQVHTFDTRRNAETYLTKSRGYTLDNSREAAEIPEYFDFYNGPLAGEKATLRAIPSKYVGGALYRVAFWLEGDIKVTPIVADKPTWHGAFRLAGIWHRVNNDAGNPIAYASPEAAHAGAQFSLDEVNRNTVRSA